MEDVGRIIKELCETRKPRWTSDRLASELKGVGCKVSSSYLRGVMTGKNRASYKVLAGCERVFNLKKGRLTKFAVGYLADELAEKYGVSTEEVFRLLQEYLRDGPSR